MTTLLQCIQAAKQTAKRKAPAQARPAATLGIISAEQLDTSSFKSQRQSTAVAHPANTPASPSSSARVPDTALSVFCERLDASDVPQSEIISHRPQRCDSPQAHAHPVSADVVGMLLPDPPETEMPAFTAKEFYGAPRLTAVELRVQRFLSHVRQRLRTVGHPFEVFPLQAKAFEFADDHELSELLRQELTHPHAPSSIFHCTFIVSKPIGYRHLQVQAKYCRPSSALPQQLIPKILPLLRFWYLNSACISMQLASCLCYCIMPLHTFGIDLRASMGPPALQDLLR